MSAPVSSPGPCRPAASSLWRAFLRRRDGRLALVLLGGLLVTAAAADFLASDRPIVAHLDGRTFWLANLHTPAELQSQTTQTLWARMGPEDWLIPAVVPWGSNEQDKGEAPLAPPSFRHWLGTDTARRDVLARLIHGARPALLVGVTAVSILVLLGTLLGLCAGFFGGLIDALVNRVIETLMTIPVLFLILAVLGVVERAGLGTVMVIIGLVSWTRVARLVRAETLRLRQAEFVLAAVALGLPSWRVVLRHILPHTLGPVWVSAAFGMAGAILTEASLSFLGFGAADTVATWGGILRGAMGNFHAWWLVAFPGAAIFATVTAYNVCGEALADLLDPQGRRE